MDSFAQSGGEGSVDVDILANPSLINMDEEIAFSLQNIEDTFDTKHGILKPQETMLVRPYSDDSDDQVLAEIKPRFIIMFEPDQDFVRRVEVSRLVLLNS